MANLLNQNPIIINSVQSSYKAATVSTLGTPSSLRVRKVYWWNPTAVGDQVIIIDPSNGKHWLDLRCEVANQSQFIPLSELWADFAVVEIDSGTLEIHIG
jgi:hypothetical protein